MNDCITRLLDDNGIRPTPNRIMIIRELCSANAALSLSDLEGRLGTVDKSSVFRTLTLLTQHHIIHQINDSTGQTKYALCQEDCRCSEPHHKISDSHIHFHCEKCKKTYCLPSKPIPEIDLPDGFHVHDAEMIIKGLCPTCIKKYGCKI